MAQSFSERRINNYLRLLCALRLFVGVTFRGAILRLQDIPRSLLYRPYPTFHLQKGNRFLLPSLISLPPVPPLRRPTVLSPVSPSRLYRSVCCCSSFLLLHAQRPRRIETREKKLSRLPPLVPFPFLLASPTSLFYGNPKHLGLELRSRRKMSLECAHDSLSPSVLQLCSRNDGAEFSTFANFDDSPDG